MGAVALVVAGHFAPGFDDHRMYQHDRFFIRRARAALEQERILFGEIFALDKKFVERRMPPVGSLRRQHHFAVTGQFQPPGAVAVVQDVHPPDFDTIRADGDSGAQGNAIVRTLELHLVRIKQHFLSCLRRALPMGWQVADQSAPLSRSCR